jgi:hypothetical protein
VRSGAPAPARKRDESCVTPPGRMIGGAAVRCAMLRRRRMEKALGCAAGPQNSAQKAGSTEREASAGLRGREACGGGVRGMCRTCCGWALAASAGSARGRRVSTRQSECMSSRRGWGGGIVKFL